MVLRLCPKTSWFEMDNTFSQGFFSKVITFRIIYPTYMAHILSSKTVVRWPLVCTFTTPTSQFVYIQTRLTVLIPRTRLLLSFTLFFYL